LRTFILFLSLALSSFLAQAQSGTPDSAKPKAKVATKPEAAKPANAKPANAKHVAAKSAAPAKMAQKEVPPQPPLEADLMAISEQVHLGTIPCEMGQKVVLTADPLSPGRFYMAIQQHRFHLTPVASRTGAIRLEDAEGGAFWIQLSNKSMLMSSKLGQRLADDCQSPAQMAVAEAMKLAPPVNLLDGGRDVAKN
jgi:hypothetical protein